jgi:hypothetical protein
LQAQPPHYPELPSHDAQCRAWADLCQMVMASNAYLYVE